MPEETTVETSAGSGADAPAGGQPPKETEPQPAGNRWADLGTEIAKLGEAKIGDLGATTVQDEKPGEKPAAPKGDEGEKPGAKAEEERAGEKPDADAEDEAKGEEDEDKQGPEARYAVIGPDGSEFEFEALPKGAKIVFPSGGKRIEVTDLNQLVELAQQGAAHRTAQAKFDKTLSKANTTIRGLAQKLEAADKAFREIVEDTEKYKEYRARARKLLDPDYRDGLEAKRKLEAKERQEEEQGEEVVEQSVTEFWDEFRNQFDARLERFSTLEAEDFPDVVRAFWSDFQAHRQALYNEMLPVAEQKGVSEAELAAEVDREAIEWLTEEHLEATMQRIHDRYERRAGRNRGNGGKPKALTPEEAAQREADAHNRHVDEKLRQRDTTRLLRGGKGAPPGPGGERQERPRTWSGHMASIHEEFDKARKPAVD